MDTIIHNLQIVTNKSIMWKHILTLCAFVNPSINAKDILKKDNSTEENFLTNIINTVEENVSDDITNPMEAVGNIMSSGIFTDLVGSMSSGLQNGELDLGKLMGTVNNMVGSLSKLTDDLDDDEMGGSEMKNMMGNLTSMMDKMTQNEVNKIDEEEVEEVKEKSEKIEEVDEVDEVEEVEVEVDDVKEKSEKIEVVEELD